MEQFEGVVWKILLLFKEWLRVAQPRWLVAKRKRDSAQH